MNIRKSFTRKNDNTGVYVSYDSIEECPNCKKALAPQNLYGIIHLKNDKETLSVADFCNGCHSSIVSEYEISKKIRRTNSNGTVEYDDKEYKMESLNHSAPVNFKEREFDDKLKKLSPQFVKVYNQALKAEDFSLDEISGLGYRKALEFLIKDFAIYNNPEKEEQIKSTWMMKCLKEYIDNEKIKTLAEKSEWIGNDEAHYVKIQDDRDINDMKSFIDALVYFVSMSLIVDDAQTMKSKKENAKNE